MSSRFRPRPSGFFVRYQQTSTSIAIYMYLSNQYHLTQDAYWPIVEGAAPHPSPEGSPPVGDPFYHMNQATFGPYATIVPIIESNDGG